MHILHADSLVVEEVGNLLVLALILVDARCVWVVLSLAGRALVDANRKKMGGGVFGSDGGNDLVRSILNNGELSGVGNEAGVGSVEEGED